MNYRFKQTAGWLIGLGLITTLAWATPAPPVLPIRMSPTPDPGIHQPIKALSRTIVVTYKDRSIERTSVVSGDHYVNRAAYETTPWGRRIATDIAARYHLEILSQWPISELGVHCVVYRIPAGIQVQPTLIELRHNRRIESVQPMNTFRTMALAYNDPYYRLQDNIHLMQVHAAHRYATGKRIRIVVIDTGIDRDHQDLRGQVVVDKDYSDTLYTPLPADQSAHLYDAHGTAVAGIIGAVADNQIGIVGVAPGARLISMKACSASADRSLSAVCNSLTLAQALNQAIRMRPDIINLSLGGPSDPLLQRLIEQALNDGIIVVAAASPTPAGTIAFPASMDGVIAVSDQPRPAADGLSLLAPGLDVLSTVPHNTYDFVSGSSISAATVSGLAALILQLRPHQTPAEIVAILDHATTRGPDNASLTINACHMMVQLRSETSKNRAPADLLQACTTVAAR